MKILRFTHLFMAAIALIMASCDSDTPDTPQNDIQNPVITFEKSDVELSHEAGSYTLNYTISNPLAGASIIANCEESWLTITTISDSSVSFNVEANNTFDERVATIVVKYPKLDSPVNVTVRQAAPENTIFSFDIQNLTTTSCTGIITTQDDSMYYIAILSDVEYLTNNNLLTEDALFKDDYDYYAYEASQAGMPLSDFVKSYVAKQGRCEMPWKNMTPASTYVLYAYGIEFEGNSYKQATPIQHMIIETPLPKLYDATFDIDITVNGRNVSFDMTPHNWDGYYCIDFYSSSSSSYLPQGEAVDEEYTRRIAQNWIGTLIDGMDMGLDMESVVATYCFTGPTLYEYTLRGNVDYIAVVYAVEYYDDLPQLVSQPTVAYFTTGN